MADLLQRVRAEIDARMGELRPAVAEYERLLAATEAFELRPSPRDADPAPRARPPARRTKSPARRRGSGRAPRMGAVERAVVAALEHGSHTLGELVLVTAMDAADIRASLRGLQRAGRVERARRSGRAAYALSGRA